MCRALGGMMHLPRSILQQNWRVTKDTKIQGPFDPPNRRSILTPDSEIADWLHTLQMALVFLCFSDWPQHWCHQIWRAGGQSNLTLKSKGPKVGVKPDSATQSTTAAATMRNTHHNALRTQAPATPGLSLSLNYLTPGFGGNARSDFRKKTRAFWSMFPV